MRTVVLMLASLLIASPAALGATTATFTGENLCGAPTGVPVLRVSGCDVAHAGTASLVSCSAGACTIAVTASASATLPAAASLAAVIEGDDGDIVICSDSSTTGGDLACEGSATVTLVVPSGCRLFVVRTVGSASPLVSGAVLSELSVCTNGSIATV